jgi:RNA polymerase sigma factor (sigma-70 family)
MHDRAKHDRGMHDRDIVAAIVARDGAGLAAAYDRYAAALYTYCRSLLAEPADAADAVQDTFVVASAKLEGLRDPDRLRPWLYAVARNECHRRLRARARVADLEEAGEMSDDSADVDGEYERGELRELVRSAIAGLNPGEREVIELTVRHELDGADLAGALGVPVNQAHALASRARGQLERSLGALLVARTGRESCPELDEILVGWGGNLTVLLRKRVSRHIENCDVCGERKRRELSPAMLLSALPVFILPAGLRQQVLRLVSDPTPDAVHYRRYITRRAEPFGPAGFPVPVFAVARARPRGRTVAYAAAAVIVLLAGGGATAGVLLDSGGGPVNAAHTSGSGTGPTSGQPGAAGLLPSPASSRSRVPATPSPTAASSAGSPSATPTQTPTPTGTPTPTPARTPTPTRTPSPPPTKSPAPPPPPPPGTLVPSATQITLTSATGGPPFTGTFNLTASGGPVTFTITVPAGLIVSPTGGSLTSGQTVTVTVTADANNPPPFTSVLTLNPGGLTVTVLYPPSG